MQRIVTNNRGKHLDLVTPTEPAFSMQLYERRCYSEQTKGLTSIIWPLICMPKFLTVGSVGTWDWTFTQFSILFTRSCKAKTCVYQKK